MVKNKFKRKKKAKYRISPKEKKKDAEKKEKLTLEQKFYWVRTGVAAISSLLGVLVFNLIGWWMLLYLFLFMVGWPFFQSFVIFRLPYVKDEWDWKKILKTGVGANFFTFMLIATVCFSLVTLSDYRLNVNNRADTRQIVRKGDNLFVADGSNGFIIVNAENINNREFLGKYSSDNQVFNRVIIDDDLAILSTESSEIYLINILDLENPILIQSYLLNSTINEMKIDGSIIYLATSDGLVLINYNNLSNIEFDDINQGSSYQNLWFYNQSLFIVDSIGNLFYNDLANISLGELNDSGYDVPQHIQISRIYNDLLYLSTNTSDISILNISNPNNPILVDSASYNGTTNDLLVLNENIILMALGGDRIQMINLTDVDNFAEANVTVHYLYETKNRDCYDIEFWDNNLLVSHGLRGIYILDINDLVPNEVPAPIQSKSIPFGWTWVVFFNISILSIYFIEKHKVKYQNR